jgi:hypothetical protein
MPGRDGAPTGGGAGQGSKPQAAEGLPTEMAAPLFAFAGLWPAGMERAGRRAPSRASMSCSVFALALSTSPSPRVDDVEEMTSRGRPVVGRPRLTWSRSPGRGGRCGSTPYADVERTVSLDGKTPGYTSAGQQRLATTGVAGAVAAVMTRQPPLNVLLLLPLLLLNGHSFVDPERVSPSFG